MNPTNHGAVDLPLTPRQNCRRGLQFAARMRNMRALGLGLGAISVASALQRMDPAPATWVFLFVSCFLWPHAAYAHATHSKDPSRAEFRNLEFDALLGGMWVAAIGFNVLPSVLILTMLWMGDIAAGGWRLFARALVLQGAGVLLVWLVAGPRVELHSDMVQVVASMPFLLVYPLTMSTLLRTLSKHVTRQNTLLETQNRTDTLTALANRQHFEAVATLELERARAARRPATLMMIDVDGFKTVNDRDGHLAGDATLAAVAQVLRDSVRGADVPGRYAGDEFTVLLPETGLACGLEVAERIRARVAALRIGETGRRCTVSIGVAELHGTMRDVRDWLHVADQALYMSKRSGRNRVCTPQGVVALRRIERVS